VMPYGIMLFICS